MNRLVLFLTPFLFLACTTTTPTISQYRIDTNATSGSLSQTACKEKSLKIAQAFSSDSLMTHKMRYAQGKYKQYVFSQAEWAETPNRAITDEILRYIREKNLFKNVQISKSRSRNGFLLETSIEEFMQYFSEDETESYVKVKINLTFIDIKTSKVLSTKTIFSRVKVESVDALGGVKALNKALKSSLLTTDKWLGELCQ